jgi:hypothetical protein
MITHNYGMMLNALLVDAQPNPVESWTITTSV